MLSRQASLFRRPARPAARALTAVAFAAALAVGGCGEDESDLAGEPATALEVTLDADGSGGQQAQAAQLSCPGSAGCAELDGVTRADLAPVPPTTACTEIFGGPDVVTIEGELEGEPVKATLNRSNGCEIERFGGFLPVLEALFEGYEPGAALTP